MTHKFIDLFAGIGGFHLAFHNLGAKCVFASEKDILARKTYQTNFYNISPELFDAEYRKNIYFVTAIKTKEFLWLEV